MDSAAKAFSAVVPQTSRGRRQAIVVFALLIFLFLFYSAVFAPEDVVRLPPGEEVSSCPPVEVFMKMWIKSKHDRNRRGLDTLAKVKTWTIVDVGAGLGFSGINAAQALLTEHDLAHKNRMVKRDLMYTLMTEAARDTHRRERKWKPHQMCGSCCGCVDFDAPWFASEYFGLMGRARGMLPDFTTKGGNQNYREFAEYTNNEKWDMNFFKYLKRSLARLFPPGGIDPQALQEQQQQAAANQVDENGQPLPPRDVMLTTAIASQLPPMPPVKAVDLYLFEPNPKSCSFLEQQASKAQHVFVSCNAVGNYTGKLPFLKTHHMDSTTARVAGGPDGVQTIDGPVTAVNMVRLDDYLPEKGVSHIDLLVTDSVGLDRDVLHGAESYLKEHKIGMIMFKTTSHEFVAPREGEAHWAFGSLQRLENFGYRCYFPTERRRETPPYGRMVVEITHNNWQPEYEVFMSRNVAIVCIADDDGDLKEALDEMTRWESGRMSFQCFP